MIERPKRTFAGALDRTVSSIFAPQPLIRLELIRVLAPLAILGFMANRIVHTDDWLSTAGFRIPALDDDWRQPASLAGLPGWAAWTVSLGLVVSGLAVAAGAFTRIASALFAAGLVYVALADRGTGSRRTTVRASSTRSSRRSPRTW